MDDTADFSFSDFRSPFPAPRSPFSSILLEKEIKGLDKSLWEFFGGWGGVELWLILLNMGYYTLCEESYILEIQIQN